MSKSIIAGLFLGAVTCLSSTAHAATVSLIGSDLSLRTLAQATPTSEVFVTSFPVSATVSETEVEFPDVASLFDPSVGVPPGFESALVDVAIDAGADYLEIDFTNSAPDTLFATGFQNTYVFTFDAAVALEITGAVIDTDATTLGLSDDRVTFSGNELFVNVQSLSFNTTSFARINLVAEESPMSPVPLPAGLPLILSALLGLGFFTRRRNAG